MSIQITPAIGIKAFFEKEQIIPTNKESIVKYLAYSKFVELFLALMYTDASTDSDLQKYAIFSHCSEEQIAKYKSIRQEFNKFNETWEKASLLVSCSSTIYAKLKAYSDKRTSVYPIGNSISPKQIAWASIYIRNEKFIQFLQDVLHVVYSDLKLWKLPFEESPYMYTSNGTSPWLWLNNESEICTFKDLQHEDPINNGCIPISMYSVGSSVYHMQGSTSQLINIIDNPSIDENFNVVYSTNYGKVNQNELLAHNKSYFAFTQMLELIEKGGTLDDAAEEYYELCTGFDFTRTIDFSIVNKTMK